MTDGDQNKLGEVLRTAREAKDVDLARVERDTKIRARYLQALEDGDYAELPGAVYTKGFLRNYGAYLGLDTEYLDRPVPAGELAADQREAHRPSPPPRPISTRRSRPLVVTPGVIMAALLTVGVVVVSSPTSAAQLLDVRAHASARHHRPGRNACRRTTSCRVHDHRRSPSRTRAITVDGLRENPTVTADAQRRLPQ